MIFVYFEGVGLASKELIMASRVTVGSRRRDSTKSGESFVVSVRVRPLIPREISSNASKVSFSKKDNYSLFAAGVHSSLCSL